MPVSNKTIVVWLMGPTSSGKSTIAKISVEKPIDSAMPVIHFDGDEIRDFFGADFGFAKNNRGRVVETLTHLDDKTSKAGSNIIVSALTTHQSAGDHIKRY